MLHSLILKNQQSFQSPRCPQRSHTGVCPFRRATKRSSDPDIHSSSCGGVAQGGAAGTLKPLMIGSRVSQSVSAQRGRGGFWFEDGAVRVIVIGTWSEPVEGREASQLLIRGRRRGFAKARSDRRACVPCQGKPCVLTWGIKEGEAGFCRFLKIRSRRRDLPVREVPKRVRERVVDVEVP